MRQILFLIFILTMSCFAIDDVARNLFASTYTLHQNVADWDPPDSWYVTGIFYDIPPYYIALIASSLEENRNGYDWHYAHFDESTQTVEILTHKNHDYIYCLPSYLLNLERINKPNILMAHSSQIEKNDIVLNDSTALISIDTNLTVHTDIVTNGLKDIMFADDFISLRSVKKYVYTGLNCVLSTNKHRWSVSAEGIDLSLPTTPTNLTSAIQTYRTTIATNTPVHAILLDADNDGKTDVYLSSEAERFANGKYSWHLYLNQSNNFACATNRIYYSRIKPENENNAWYCLDMLDPVEVAYTNAFFRLTLAPLRKVNLVLESTASNVISHAEQAVENVFPLGGIPKHPRRYKNTDEEIEAFANWYYNIEHTMGAPPPDPLDFYVTSEDFISLDRLPCITFAPNN